MLAPISMTRVQRSGSSWMTSRQAATVATLAGGMLAANDTLVTGATWGWIALLALVPQLIGHSTFNWALRALPATLVALALLGEPVGSAALAFAVLGEVPSHLTLAGAALILAGVVLAVRDTPAAGSAD